MTRHTKRRDGKSALRLALARQMWDWEPHPSQKAWLLDDSGVKAAACGRRWGKTEAESIDAATYAMIFPDSRQIIVAPTYDQARLIANGVERLLLAHPRTRKCTRIKRTPYPQIDCGSASISARSADDDGRGLRGHYADRVIVDEAAFVRDSVVQEVIQPMLADSAGQLILISTPFGRNHFWRTWTAGQAGREGIRSFRFPSSDNPHISRSYIERQKIDLPPRAFQAEYLAEFVQDASAVFRYADLEDCLTLGREPGGGGEKRIAVGIDWARYRDYTVCVALQISRRPWRVAAIDRFHGLSWEAAVERAACFLEMHQAETALCDATSVGDPVIEQLEKRMRQGKMPRSEISGLVFSPASKRELIDNLALRVAHRDIALPPDSAPHAEALRSEMEIYQYQIGPSGAVVYSAPQGSHDDCVTALALAAWQARNAPEFGVFVSSNLHGAW